MVTSARASRSGRRIIGFLVKLRLALLGVLIATVSGAQSYDLLLRNGRVVDGSGAPWFRADVGIRGDSIAAIGPHLEGDAARVIDVGDDIVAPGFIDIHTHSRRGILEVPTADNYVRQGVTTVFEGQDGSSDVPLGPFLDELENTPISLNFASFIGHGSVRSAVLGEVDRPAAPDDLADMRELVRQGMRDGAFGMSTGLFYVPGAFSTTEEVAGLARVVGELGGIHISHMRDEASQILDSVRETIEIGEIGGLPTQITHHKVIGPPNWGRSVETLRMVDEARARGVDVSVDQYPYTASSTGIISALWPKWAREGGREAVLERLADPDARARIRAESAVIIRDERGGGDASRVQIAVCEWDESLAGQTLADLTRTRGLAPNVVNAADTAIWIVEQGGCQGVFHAIGEEDLVRILRHPAVMVASDGGVIVYGRGVPHPRSYGTFARVLGRYVRDQGVLTLEEAVRKMTSLPAQRTGLEDRGLLRPAMKADLVVFDPEAVRDTATFEAPHAYAEGFSLVVVNGRVAFEGGAMSAERPGRVLRGRGYSH